MEMIGALPMLVAKGGAAYITLHLLGLAIKHKVKINKKTGSKATAKLKQSEEMEDLLGDNGLMLSENIRLKEKFDYEHIGIIAPTGSGKTTKLFYPNLLDENIKGSIVVIDAKGELYRDTSEFQKNVCNRRVLKFSPLEPSDSEQYNLLEQCEDSTEVSQLASSLLMNGALSGELISGKKSGGIEWIQMAEPLLAAALLFVKDLGEPFNTIEYAFKMIINTHPRMLDALFMSSKNEDVITQYSIFRTVSGAENTAASIKVTLASNLKLFTDNKLNYVSRSTTFTAEELRKEPTVLYITYPERKSAYLAPYIAPFFNQLIDKLLDNYNHKSEPIHFLMDEFPNIGMISNMSLYCATVRSRKISFMLCMQSITQLYQVYGRDNGKAILNNLKTKILLSGISDIETLQYIENLCGKSEVNTKTENVNSKNEVNYSYSTTIKNVLNQDEVRRIDNNKCLIISGNKQPVQDSQLAFYEDNEYTEKVKVASTGPHKNINLKTDFNKFRELLQSMVQEKEEEQEQDRTQELMNELY